MAKKKVAYSVTKSGAAHKRRKHPVLSEDEQLRRAARAIRKDRADKKDQRKRRAAGLSTPAERAFKKSHLDGNGKFRKGNPGKKKGTKARVPGERKIKASVRDLIEEVVRDNPRTIRDALKRGLRSGPRHADRYLKLAAEYMDGKPIDTINLNSQYKQDELESARRSLSQQLNKIFKTIVANREQPPDGSPAAEES